jgi:hypothetical protein
VLVVGEARAPAPADACERAHEHAARDRHPGPDVRAVRVRTACRRDHACAEQVRVLDIVHVDRFPVRVHRPRGRPRCDRATAIERGRVVRSGRAVVVAAVRVDRAHPPNREPRLVERPEDDGHLRHDASVDHELADVPLAVEADVTEPNAAELRR